MDALRDSAAAIQVNLDAVARIIAAAPDLEEATRLRNRNTPVPAHGAQVFQALVALSIARQIARWSSGAGLSVLGAGPFSG